MKSLKVIGLLLLVTGLVLLLAAIITLFSSEASVPEASGDRDFDGRLYAVFGAGGLVIGVVLMLVEAQQAKRASRPSKPTPAAAAKRKVEIKRTRMEVGSTGPTQRGGAPSRHGPGSAHAVSELDQIKRRMSRLKVRYGMGDISAESYKRLMADLEKEQADLEMESLD